jgi:hypothetical protein
MARHGQVTPEVDRLLSAAREQWGDAAVQEYNSGQFKVRPSGSGRVVFVSGKGRARGAANAKSMLRQAGLKL